MIKRSHNPEKAITDIRFEISNNKLESKLVEGERAVAVPVKMYDNTSEKKGLFPFLIYKKTTTGLKNEEEKLKSLIDIQPLVSNSPFCNPILGYKKNPFELTNFKGNESAFNFSHFYVNFCTKYEIFLFKK